jgi:hypothetical protein
LDQIVERVYRVNGHDPAAIARAIGESERLVAAIAAGLSDHPHRGPEISPAQAVREAILDAIEAPIAAHENR